MNRTTIFALCWRVLAAVFTRTFFQPDEYFQSLEVAHHLVFGYGHLTWEWTTSPPIRSVVLPLLYAPAFWILRVLHVDDGILLILTPKVIQGLIAALTDISLCRLVHNVLGERYVLTAYFLSITSFFHLLCLSRTLANSVETALTTFALSFWPLSGQCQRRQVIFSLSVAAFTCTLRPTSGILWMWLWGELVWRQRQNKAEILFIVKATLIVGACTLLIQTAIDTLYFGRLTFTPLNFLFTNMSSVSLFYGRNPWHFYVTQALPLLCTTCLPFFVLGSLEARKSDNLAVRRIIGLIAWTVTVYSFVGHKEWRFIHPMLPLIHLISAKAIVGPSVHSSGKSKVSPQREPKLRLHPASLFPVRRSIAFFLALGLLPSIYVMRYHSRAQIEVMDYLRSLDTQNLKSVGFMMPCHSTPMQAYLHRPHLTSPGRLWAIGCEPPTRGQDLSTYQDQSDIFFRSPIEYLKDNFPDDVDPTFPPSPLPATTPGTVHDKGRWDHTWPSHFVMFGTLLEHELYGRETRAYIQSLGYNEVWSGRNSWEEDPRRRGGVRVWAWSDDETTK